jgi:hypothetical protein
MLSGWSVTKISNDDDDDNAPSATVTTMTSDCDNNMKEEEEEEEEESVYLAMQSKVYTILPNQNTITKCTEYILVLDKKLPLLKKTCEKTS